MANASTSQHTDHPALNRVRALLALMLQYLGDPTRAHQLERLFEQAERLLVKLYFEAAARLAGRLDLLHTHEAYAVTRRGIMHIRIRPKLSAFPLFQQIIWRRRRSAALNRYRTAIGCRARLSAKRSCIRAKNQRRRQAVAMARSQACAAPASHTPSRAAAPP